MHEEDQQTITVEVVKRHDSEPSILAAELTPEPTPEPTPKTR